MSLVSPVIDAATDVAPVSRPARPERIRLDLLDGLRGLASLSVVYWHVVILFDQWDISPMLRSALQLVPGGRPAVGVFIVLSGYCLMLPVVSETGRRRGPDTFAGFLPYLRRRAWRILPAYYAAIAVALIMMALWPGGRPADGWWASMWPQSMTSTLLAHVFLVHNFSEHWVTKLDAPMWSVATEWQIYFLFPLVLLPLMRRAGSVATILIGTALGILPIALFRRFDWAAPWYAGLFAMGMAAARTHPNLPGTSRHAGRLPWGWLTLLALGLVAAAQFWQAHSQMRAWRLRLVSDLAIGLLSACFLSWAAQRVGRERQQPAMRRSITLAILQSPAVVWLGSISYSLYLVHALVLVLIQPHVHRIALGTNARAMTFLLLVLALSIPAAYLFSLAFERPFLKRRAA